MFISSQRSLPEATMLYCLILLMIVITVMGIYMLDSNNSLITTSHTSLGWAVLLLFLPRVFWRMKHGWPISDQFSRKEKLASTFAHWLLLITLLLMPISGILMSIGDGQSLAFYGLLVIDLSSDNLQQAIVLPLSLATLGQSIHSNLGYILPFVIGFQLAAL